MQVGSKRVRFMMEKWMDKFQKNTLLLGKEYFDRGRVFELEETDGIYTASVVERQRREVRITGYGNPETCRMYCTCPHAKSGSYCKHMAAVMYAIEEFEEQKEKYAWEDGQMQKAGTAESYTYFDKVKIKESLHLPIDSVRKGKALLAANKITLERIDTSYYEGWDELLGIIEGLVESDKTSFPVRIVFARDRVVSADCCCGMYARNFYRYYTQMDNCEHIAALMHLLSEYLEKNPIGDATDVWGNEIIRLFQKNRANQTISDVMGNDESIVLKPRLVEKDGRLIVSFKIGQKKLLLIKDLFEFEENVRNSAMGTYGTNMQLNHRPENFTPQGRLWIEFIGSLVREESELGNRIIESGAFTRKSLVKRNEMRLFGWRLDRFFEIASGESVLYEAREGGIKKKCELTCRQGNPKITMMIRKNHLDKGKIFHGISVECDVPFLFYGVHTLLKRIFYTRWTRIS